jgi:Protein of unknown function (DUF1488)
MRGRVAFPNGSRSYDATRLAVRFWGYDQSMEVSFFVAEDVLRRLRSPTAAKYNDILEVFDAHRYRIYEVAATVYARGARGSYDLQANDF